MKKIIVALVLSTLTLSGCGLFHSGKPWKDAKQENPLEIPPNMNRPNVSDALTIPSVNAQQAPPAAPTPAAQPGVLHLNGDVGTAYKRVGLALGNGDIGNITSQSDSNHTYQVAMATKMQIGSSKGFLQRHFSNTQNADGAGASASSDAGAQAASVTVQVTAAPEGGSNVSATGDPQQVARLMTALKARLGG